MAERAMMMLLSPSPAPHRAENTGGVVTISTRVRSSHAEPAGRLLPAGSQSLGLLVRKALIRSAADCSRGDDQ